MAGRLVAILLLVTYAGSMNGEQIATHPAIGPTLLETTEWLQSHLVGVSHGRRKTVVTYRLKKGKLPKEVERQITDTHESVSGAKFSGCSLVLEQLAKGDDYSVITTSTVPLDRLTVASLNTEKYDATKTGSAEESTETTVTPASVVVIKLEASSNIIPYRRKSTGNVSPEWNAVPYAGNHSSLIIRSDDQQMPPRLVKAFNHALQLCHTDLKPEPF
jgi:hypothetical protein